MLIQSSCGYRSIRLKNVELLCLGFCPGTERPEQFSCPTILMPNLPSEYTNSRFVRMAFFGFQRGSPLTVKSTAWRCTPGDAPFSLPPYCPTVCHKCRLCWRICSTTEEVRFLLRGYGFVRPLLFRLCEMTGHMCARSGRTLRHSRPRQWRHPSFTVGHVFRAW